MGYGKKIITILMNKALLCYSFFKKKLFIKNHSNIKRLGENMNNEIIKFVNGDLQLDVTVSPDNETVWLNRNQLAQLFDRDVKTIGKHINNALKEELDDSTVAKFATVQTEGNRKNTKIY